MLRRVDVVKVIIKGFHSKDNMYATNYSDLYAQNANENIKKMGLEPSPI